LDSSRCQPLGITLFPFARWCRVSNARVRSSRRGFCSHWLINGCRPASLIWQSDPQFGTQCPVRRRRCLSAAPTCCPAVLCGSDPDRLHIQILFHLPDAGFAAITTHLVAAVAISMVSSCETIYMCEYIVSHDPRQSRPQGFQDNQSALRECREGHWPTRNFDETIRSRG
jgi:hypothetical protein